MKLKHKKDSKDDSSEVKVTKRRLSDVVEVCPVCFSPIRRTPQLFFVNNSFHCDNCGWSGSIIIEVNRDDYEKFLEEKKKERTK